MKVSLANVDGEVITTIDVSPELEVENFKALCEVECGIPAAHCALRFDGQVLTDPKKSLQNCGVKDGDLVIIQMQVGGGAHQTSGGTMSQMSSGAVPQIDFSSIQVPQNMASTSSGSSRPPRPQNPEDPAVIREMLLKDPKQLAWLKETNPPLAEALQSGSLDKFREVLEKQRKAKADKEMERIRMINSNPFDPSAQQYIAEEIRQRNVDANMETAIEHAPEAFGQVIMLYINCTVNGYPVKAFVDSGAQMTIMSQACAERCNIMRLVDRRWEGIAKGVGTQKIIGRVHLGQIQIVNDFLQSSFTILEHQPMDMLLGLDMLKRHQCVIDLKNNVLQIGTTGTQTPFLAEADLPPCARLNRTESAEQTMRESEDQQLAQALAKSAEEATKGTSSSGGSTSAAESHNFPEATIKLITDLGFTREQAIEELKNSNGNPNSAAAALLAKSLKLPGQQ